MLLIVALAAIIVLSWFVWSFNSLLGETRTSLEDAEGRVQQLEERLAGIEGNVNESGETTQQSFDYWESEIRKLWDIANKRNRDWIEENQADIVAFQKDIQRLDGKDKSIDQSFADFETSITTLARQQQDLTDNINISNQQSSALREQFEGRVRNNEEAVIAIDASRIQNNNRLLDLERRIRNLEQGN